MSLKVAKHVKHPGEGGKNGDKTESGQTTAVNGITATYSIHSMSDVSAARARKQSRRGISIPPAVAFSTRIIGQSGEHFRPTSRNKRHNQDAIQSISRFGCPEWSEQAPNYLKRS